ncbi:MAG: hypothetical protein ACRCTP_22815, partial [Aeromonas popoffii]|uniref:hypothetical protein n=1 Tax=Aeromonas popoffii TaxID=70856 RepID=UPI003F3DBFB7
SGRSDGVCERDKQTEHPWSACKKAPSVAVTRGWGSHDLLADLGNNAGDYPTNLIAHYLENWGRFTSRNICAVGYHNPKREKASGCYGIKSIEHHAFLPIDVSSIREHKT